MKKNYIRILKSGEKYWIEDFEDSNLTRETNRSGTAQEPMKALQVTRPVIDYAFASCERNGLPATNLRSDYPVTVLISPSPANASSPKRRTLVIDGFQIVIPKITT